MANNCEDCGCRVYSGKCTNCHEELYIVEQYAEQGMNLPKENTEFMKRVREQEKSINEKK